MERVLPLTAVAPYVVYKMVAEAAAEGSWEQRCVRRSPQLTQRRVHSRMSFKN
jgi:hypothetical protein